MRKISYICLVAVVTDYKQYKDPGSTPHAMTEDTEQLPLPEGVLTNNIGLPIIVVVTKVGIEYCLAASQHQVSKSSSWMPAGLRCWIL